MILCFVLNKKMYLCKIRNESSYTMELKTLIATKKQITRKKKKIIILKSQLYEEISAKCFVI